MDLKDIQKEMYKIHTSKGWHEPSKTLTDSLLLVHAEVSEAVEELRDGRDPVEVYLKNGSSKPEGFGIELADCVIRIMNICEGEGIDLEEMIRVKSEYNKTRPHRHGKAF